MVLDVHLEPYALVEALIINARRLPTSADGEPFFPRLRQADGSVAQAAVSAAPGAPPASWDAQQGHDVDHTEHSAPRWLQPFDMLVPLFSPYNTLAIEVRFLRGVAATTKQRYLKKIGGICVESHSRHALLSLNKVCDHSGMGLAAMPRVVCSASLTHDLLVAGVVHHKVIPSSLLKIHCFLSV